MCVCVWYWGSCGWLFAHCILLMKRNSRISDICNVTCFTLTLKAPITTAADRTHKYFFHCFSVKIRLDVSSESSRQRIHMKNQALFSSKDKSKKLKRRLLHFLFGALRVIFNSIIRYFPNDVWTAGPPQMRLVNKFW